MMTGHDLPDFLLNHIVDKISDTSNPSRIILYGSRARGEARPDSDIDLMVVVPDQFGPNRSRWQEVKRLRSAVDGIHPKVDIVVFSEDEFERFAGRSSHVVADAVQDGISVYTNTDGRLVRGAA